MKTYLLFNLILLLNLSVNAQFIDPKKILQESIKKNKVEKQTKKDTVEKFSTLKKQIKEITGDSTLKNASISFYAYDLKSKEVIAEHNADVSLIPASSQKIIVTAAALEYFGANYRFKTTIEHDGSIDASGTLNGNIYIKGGGDPALGSPIFKNHYKENAFLKTWADSIAKKGIKKINGRIIGDAEIFDDQTPVNWIWGDMGNYYGATAYGISIFDNQFKVIFDTGKEKDSVKIKEHIPNIPYLKLSNQVKTYSGTEDLCYFTGGPFENERTVLGYLPKDKKNFSVRASIPDPPLFLAYLLKAQLDSINIQCTELPCTIRQLKSTDKYKESIKIQICETLSPSLSEIVFATNKYSHNLFAETLLKHIGLRSYKNTETATAANALKDFCKQRKIDTQGMFLSDGSGLSRYNSLTAKQLVGVLLYMKRSKSYYAFYNSLPAAGLSGTIRSMFKNTTAEKNLRAKSGYMSRVRSYAGYVTTKSNRDVAFAIIVNNYTVSDARMKEMIEMVLVKLADMQE
ncbi:MAG: D-alanyl-D-alanine carboxypeptidase/D-alanyl-D-alanine-endopeptidase [Bacteroidetes bacterium RIFOXYA12_FULL_35_11]|nr:MAG: D-alanyl-D-alanine carboxypeptidase/D-alanyl-D-alanine-endopeptidase [Bacteroidetes bacterium GWF2_35_48]OFY75910.1 MAG: D-alanyl-D-alanine carboxypeptidase/D-alanyl-D-alanine-endopeptidase [Bacteroidetes bacterium RIFOXYA12_FULL_35_11]OFY95734.1 MAG: D-alanyl-D-alanine carboxypeptidase/D-alanyl-D-alanine-endopeptidase [Bacteroidetes bacterium RIFOXYC12_FULL_35_7]OFY96531.1 MAG: D-alanyl-D-alanine carboxypeptidase/D-alanyl-D-alanine-endopeptidase [Bacteroidetes bacterium RIFOXYB2_FULL_35